MENIIVEDNLSSEDKRYKAISIIVKPSNQKLLHYCDENTKLAKLFRNSVIYRCRQLFFAHQKHYENLSKYELEIIAEFALIGKTFSDSKYFNLPSYTEFVKMFTMIILMTFPSSPRNKLLKKFFPISKAIKRP